MSVSASAPSVPVRSPSLFSSRSSPAAGLAVVSAPVSAPASSHDSVESTPPSVGPSSSGVVGRSGPRPGGGVDSDVAGPSGSSVAGHHLHGLSVPPSGPGSSYSDSAAASAPVLGRTRSGRVPAGLMGAADVPAGVVATPRGSSASCAPSARVLDVCEWWLRRTLRVVRWFFPAFPSTNAARVGYIFPIL